MLHQWRISAVARVFVVHHELFVMVVPGVSTSCIWPT